MGDLNETIRDHYQAGVGEQGALLARLSAMIDQLEGPPSSQALAAVDQFHVGGLKATAELAKRVGVRPEMDVLDAGSGLGGPSRYLAETFGCRVIGIDLTPDYVAIAKLLAERTGLADKVGYRLGDLTQLPFEDACFDLVWAQHVVMNIRDRDGLYRELRRVLKPGGRLAFYDPIAADEKPEPFYPVPWAASAETSTLLTEDETVAVLRGAGLKPVGFDDVTLEAMGWLIQQQSPVAQSPLNLGVVIGPRIGELVANFGRNLREGRVRLVMGVCEAV